MSIKYNEFGEVISVNGLTTGQHLGAPMQDAIAERPEDNEAYATERNTVTRNSNVNEDEQPNTAENAGGGSEVDAIFESSLVGVPSYDTWDEGNLSLKKGSFDAIANKLARGETPIVNFIVTVPAGTYEDYGLEGECKAVYQGTCFVLGDNVITCCVMCKVNQWRLVFLYKDNFQ